MRLSMNILADWLEKYHPALSIESGRRQIRGVRPFSENHKLIPSNIYVGALSSEEDSGVMCINENDFIFVPHVQPEEIIYEIMEAFDFYNNWSDEVVEGMASKSLQEILNLGNRILPQMLLVADPSYYALAYTQTVEMIRYNQSLQNMERDHIVEMPMILDIEKDRRIRENNRHVYYMEGALFGTPPMVRNLFVQEDHFGWLVVIGDSYTAGQCDLIDALGDILEQWAKLHAEASGRSNLSRSFHAILDGSPDRGRILNQLRFAGLEEETEIVLYVMDFVENTSGYSILYRLEHLSDRAYHLIHREQLISVFFGGESDRAEFERQLVPLLRQSGGVCGRSPVFSDIFRLPEEFRWGSFVSQCARRRDPDQVLLHSEDVALEYMLDILRREAGREAVHPAILQLLAYDKDNGTELTETLRIWLDCERNYAEASKQLFIHRNTLIYRIGRICELTRLDLDSPDLRLHLLLSYPMLTGEQTPD